MPRGIGALAVAAILLGMPVLAQVRRHELTKPPEYGTDANPRGTGKALEPSAEEKSLLERAQRLHNQAYGLRSKAEEFRDSDQYEEAETLDDRADALETQATDLERRAEREHIGAKGPFHPAE